MRVFFPFPWALFKLCQDKAMNKWMRMQRNIYLIQLLWRDGRGYAGEECPGCHNPNNPPLYRCQECAGGVMLCRTCCIDKHADNPLHVIYVRAVFV
jgi:hypothetical protein